MIWYTVAGFFSGIISGMGLGGGVLLVPVLTLILGVEQKTAQGINLLYFIPTAVFALIVHYKNKLVNNKLLFLIAIPGIIGSVGGSFLAMKLHNDILSKCFAGFLFLLGLYELFKKTPKSK